MELIAMARGRPPTPLGSYGEIKTTTLDTGTIQADTRLRLYNGTTVRIRARGKSKTAAVNALKEKCQQRLGEGNTTTITAMSTVELLCQNWLTKVTASGKVRPATIDRYRTAAENHIIPAFGNLRLNEVTPAFLDQWINGLSTGIQGNVRTVLNKSFGSAVIYGALSSNPMQAVELNSRNKKENTALTREEIPLFRAQIAKSNNPTLIDVVDLCLCTGLRLGEVLGLRWQDVHLDDPAPWLEVTGTIAYSSTLGNDRQAHGKTAKSERRIELAETAVDLLKRRRTQLGEHLEPVFPSGAGTFMWENNFNALLRKWRGPQFEHITVHSLRKTVSTLIAEELSPFAAAQVLGHADSRLTETTYIASRGENVPVAAVMDGVLKVSK
ncbi:site-specific integrase [Corynebacterium sp. P7003]|uniref:Site-specific integrase n=1 Tax=Corynebacterium pygosceleis TaxID=2800406 RepID=A0ABT3WQ47_9CORY|nr:site-specific integrase [Corynebacterium pygosceleis]MCX7444392.1 site-specific integrase [Corynebacterium pygosceleis]